MWRKLADVVFWIGLSLYFGGLMTIGAVVAPAVFQASREAHLSMPGIAAPPLVIDTQVGGEVFGAILNRFSFVEAAALGLMLAGLATWLLAHKQVRWSTLVLLALWTFVAGMAAYDSASLRPRVWKLREDVRQQAPAHAADAVGAAWPDREEFDRLHTASETLGRSKGYVLLAMIFVAAWRALAERRGSLQSRGKGDAMWRVVAGDRGGN